MPLLARPTAPGLRRNARLFALLLLVNGFVGAVVGTERTLVPLLGEQAFGLASATAVLSFVATFGLVKAFANLAAGAWAETAGRRRVLLAGWVAGVPVPLLLMWAPDWGWVLAANALLGVNQGLCWSMTVLMKVDIAGEERRGLAMGLNEFLGYTAVAAAAFATGWLAVGFGLRPIPFLVGLAAALLGLAATALLVPETGHLAPALARAGLRGRFGALREHTARGPMLTLNQAGLVNNLNDGVAWGLLPLLFAELLRDPGRVGALVALYPLTWGLAQLGTGPLSDRLGRKGLIASGLALQALALLALPTWQGEAPWAAAMVVYGLGTAMAYPCLLSAVADVTSPGERAGALGVYRFWRDLGFVVGALGAGLLADAAGLRAALLATAAVTFASGAWVAAGFREARGRRA
ncbi:MAG TPA: MFS transporter [Candidatus Thermoplasmatota archaeon]|jgi:MFS family permease|nr:MFS transporter [Candidatus Thermoplasmatota archaeon]